MVKGMSYLITKRILIRFTSIIFEKINLLFVFKTKLTNSIIFNLEDPIGTDV